MSITTPRAIERREQALRKMTMRGNCHGCGEDGWLRAEFTDMPGRGHTVYACAKCGFHNSEPHPPHWDHLKEHSPDGVCCAGAGRVRVRSISGPDPTWPDVRDAGLFNLLRGRPYYSPDQYAKTIANLAGETLRIMHRFEGRGGVTGYTARLPNGQAIHLPTRAVECEVPA